MSKLHVSLYVPELEKGIRYYSALFAAEPTHLADYFGTTCRRTSLSSRTT